MPILLEIQNEWISFGIFLGIIFFFIALSEIARKVFTLSPEITRKFVHVMVGVLVSLAPFFLVNTAPVIVLGVLFTVINAFALGQDSFKGMHSTERVSFGTVYFPLAFTLLVLMYWNRNIVIFIVAMLILAFADTAATVVGERVNSSRKFRLWSDKKSLPGSLAFFTTAMFVVLIAFPIYSTLAGRTNLALVHLIGLAMFTASVSTVGEAVSKRGSDNLTLTLTAALGMDLYLMSLHTGTLPQLLGWALFSSLLGWGAYKLKALSVSGGFGAFLLGLFMFGMGSWATMLPLIGFFVISTLLSKIADRSSRKDMMAKKGSQRDIVQVYANGGISLIFAIAWYLSNFQSEWLYWAFLASLATSTADTWETEVGSFSSKRPFNILTFKRVIRGYSGGVSLLGSLAGVLGSATIAGIALAQGQLSWDKELVSMIILAGFFGTVVDSILGASIQAKFVCPVCDRATERLTHCDTATRHVSGVLWFDNDWVNLAGSLSGGLIFLLTYYLYPWS